MKMFLVSIVSAPRTYKHLYINALNRFAGVTINPCAYPKLGVADARINYDDWDPLPRAFRDARINDEVGMHVAAAKWVEYVAQHHDDPMTTYTIEEVTGDLRQWFMTWGLPFTYRVYNGIVDYMTWGIKREKMHRIVDSMEERYRKLTGTGDIDPRVHYRGRKYRHAHTFKADKVLCAEMGKLITESIKEREDLFSSAFMELYQTDDDLHNRIAQAANDALRSNRIDFELDTFHCDHWGESGSGSEVNIGRGRYREYCQCCVEDTDVVIETYDTGIFMLRDQAYWSEYTQEYYEHEPEHDEDEDEDEDSEEDADRLMSYSTNVLNLLSKDDSFTSSAFGEFHMGVELELVTSGYVSEAVTDLRTQLGEDYIICKSDGSLPSGGVEVVTAPRGLHDHIKRFKDWEINSKYTAWNTGKCGMHVHIDSRAFTRMTLGKFIVFINDAKNAEFIRKIAGRHPHIDPQAQSYCAAEGQEAIENPSKALKGKSSNRYYMVNTTCLRPTEASRLGVRYVGERNFNTIELRIFRATLKKERLLAQIEFTHAVIMFCRVASMRDLDGVSFLKWLKTTDNRYPHLSDWYGIRRRAGAKNAAPTETNCADTLVDTASA